MQSLPETCPWPVINPVNQHFIRTEGTLEVFVQTLKTCLKLDGNIITAA